MTNLFNEAMNALRVLNASAASNERITNDEQGLIAAQAFALRADCTRRRVGAVTTDAAGRFIGQGRNGAPPGRPGCLSDGACPRGQLTYDQIAPGSSYSAGSGACIAIHAEVNGILNSSSPQAREGGTCYVTDAPCDDCFKVLTGSGLARVVWPERLADGSWEVFERDLTAGPVGGLYG